MSNDGVCVECERARERERVSARRRERETHTDFLCILRAAFMHIDDMCMLIGDMEWLRSVGSINLYVSFAEYCLLYRPLLQKSPIILSILLTKATPYVYAYYVNSLYYI